MPKAPPRKAVPHHKMYLTAEQRDILTRLAHSKGKSASQYMYDVVWPQVEKDLADDARERFLRDRALGAEPKAQGGPVRRRRVTASPKV